MNKSENLYFILERYDHYIESIQSKSNLYIALNSIIVSGSIAILTSTELRKLNTLLLALHVVIVIASVVSIIITLIALIPHLKTSQKKSVLFFKDVSSEKEHDFLEKMYQISKEEFDKDLIKQIHSVAKILTIKYKRMKWAGLLLIFQFVSIIVWAIIFITLNK